VARKRYVWLLWFEGSTAARGGERSLMGVFADEDAALADRDRRVGEDCGLRMDDFIAEKEEVVRG